MEKWFRRLAEVPGIEYRPDPLIDRTKLPGHDAVPKIDRSVFDGKQYEVMTWPREGESTWGSPAQSWKTQPRKDETEAQTTARQVHEQLELPGTMRDYHFLIQSCHEQLRRFARKEPCVLEEVERLCWLDIRLVDQYPQTITQEPIEIADEELEIGPAGRFYRVLAFDQLISMYLREGYLREALEVARIGNKFDQCPGTVEELEERINRVEVQANAR